MSEPTTPTQEAKGIAATVLDSLGFGKPASDIESRVLPEERDTKKLIDRNIAENQARLTRGGAWADTNPSFESDWAGERGGGEASSAQEVTHIPKTASQIDEEIIKKSGITPDVLAAITRQIENRLIKQSGKTGTSLVAILQQDMNAQKEKVEEWLKAQEGRMTTMITSKGEKSDDHEQRIAKISEELALIHEKYQALIKSTVANAREQFEIIQAATEIIKERRAVDESEAASNPSQLVPFQEAMRDTAERIAQLEPMVEQTGQLLSSRTDAKQQAKKMFGRRR